MEPSDQEIELKFRTTAAGVRAAMKADLLAPREPDARARTQNSVYFDTADLALAKRDMTLRIRRVGRGLAVMTLKHKPTRSRGPFSRDEIEAPIRAAAPQIDLFDPPIADKLAGILGERPLQPQFETRVRRRVRMIEVDGSQIEAAFDQGFIQAGERRMNLNEVELELKSGAAADLYRLGARLASDLPLRIDATSKAQAAFAFAHGEPAAPVKGAPVEFSPKASLDEAIAAILQNTLDHFIANWAALRESPQPEAVHQLRVALRRLRSALGMFKALAPSPALESFGRQAREIGAALGRARQCDVFADLVEGGPKTWLRDDTTFVALEAALEKETTIAYVAARAAIESARSSVFVIELQALIAACGWRAALTGEQVRRLEQPGKETAAQILDRLYKRVRRRGENLMELPTADRHELRVALKKLRYGAEFLRPYFRDERGARAFNREAANLQETLGALNDVAEAGDVLKTLKAENAVGTARSAGLILGWYGHNAAVAESNLLKAWKAFKRAGPFWR